MRRLVVGNWKMFGLRTALEEVRRLGALLADQPADSDVVVCPPATLLAAAVQEACGFAVGAQDCAVAPEGAFTGDVSAEMVRDAGATFVIVGHSERRQGHGESSALVCAKATAAFRAGLTPIVCIGETRTERDAGRTLAILEAQARDSVPSKPPARFAVAYEPVWAIGTGLTPTLAEIAGAHAHLRALFGPDVALLYGGSVKPANAAGICGCRNVDGVLVGGASLKADEFDAIIRAK